MGVEEVFVVLISFVVWCDFGVFEDVVVYMGDGFIIFVEEMLWCVFGLEVLLRFFEVLGMCMFEGCCLWFVDFCLGFFGVVVLM